MKIKCTIESNLHDYFQSASTYWMQAKEKKSEIDYKKAILFFGFSIELVALKLLKEQPNETIYNKKGYTKKFEETCNILSKSYSGVINSILIDNPFIKYDQQEQSIIYIKNLRNILLHNEGNIDASKIDFTFSECVLIIHYLMLSVKINLISDLTNRDWIIENIDYDPENFSSDLSQHQVYIHKDNYLYYHELYNNQCQFCGCGDTLRHYESKNYSGVICWVCLNNEEIYTCYECDIGLIESDVCQMGDFILCKNCYGHKFR